MKDRIDELASLMTEFKLNEAELSGEGYRIAFKKKSKVVVTQASTESISFNEFESEADEIDETPVDNKPTGTAITSPMTGIYYSAPSPGSPPFTSEGDTVTSGQVIGLIEAMKVFNEIPAPTSGTVHKIVVESGQLVNFGDPLLYIS